MVFDDWKDALSGTEDETLTQHLREWLQLPIPREQRHYLEAHLELLRPQCEALLMKLGAQQAEQSKEAQPYRDALLLLQDARRRGNTWKAVREAYINFYGGLVLDLPTWLDTVEQRLASLLKEHHPEQTAEERVTLLQEALEQAQKDNDIEPEVLAALRYALVAALQRHPLADHAQALETAISGCKEVLRIYTLERYPNQYASVQNVLGVSYWERPSGNRRENLELAIECYRETLRICTLDTAPFQYAAVQNNLGIVYLDRIVGERRENVEQSIVCYQEALRVWSLEAFPLYYARAQSNLGIAYLERVVGDRSENLERSLACQQNALRVPEVASFPLFYAGVKSSLGEVYQLRMAGDRQDNIERAIAYEQDALSAYTLDTAPSYYARVQNHLGKAYYFRRAGDRRENLELAIACQREALNVRTLNAFPFQYAEVQNELGRIYTQRREGEPKKNLEQAILCYQEALRVYTAETFPREFRDVQINLAEAEAQRKNWMAVKNAYTAAQLAEDLLVILGAGTIGYDIILKEGRDAAIRLGYSLFHLGHIDEAVVAIERGRARGLAEALAFDAADPRRIADEQRRKRYMSARSSLITAQADLHALSSQDLDEATRRHLDLQRTAVYRQAKLAFDASIAEINAAHDPADFLLPPLNATTILRAAAHEGLGHALVYLAATPWGGVAVSALSPSQDGSLPARFAALDLPQLTEPFLRELVEIRLQDGSDRVIGGFALAQIGGGFERLLQDWNGETLLAKINTLHTTCQQMQTSSTLDAAAQEALERSRFASLVKRPLTSLTQSERSLLDETIAEVFLQQELHRCMDVLGTTVLQNTLAWLRCEGATSLTLIPCGYLTAFPLTSIIMSDGRSIGEILPSSIAPSARSLLREQNTSSPPRGGVFALGDPTKNLPWNESEALTLVKLARRNHVSAEAQLREQATRSWLLTAFQRGQVVNASCHASFKPRDILQSALLLAGRERVTMGEILSHQVDLRGLRLLILSACQTAILDLEGARDEVHNLAVAMLQAGASAVLASFWAVDDKATYLLMVSFAQEWFPHMDQEPPAAALARAQMWLRTVTNADLRYWKSTLPRVPQSHSNIDMASVAPPLSQRKGHRRGMQERLMTVRGRIARYTDDDAQLAVRMGVENADPAACPYADPYYWAGFQVIGW